jgi:hypothetical protein|tara:strand:+ start:1407 stop:1589 length:183 start_codon:yes stop_codon:yes gene_type:complete
MPNVGNKKFSYTPEGKAAAMKASQMTGQPMSQNSGYKKGGKVGYKHGGKVEQGGKDCKTY